jgi:transposase
VVDGRGRPIAFVITPGQLGDLRVATALIGPLPAADTCLADCAYDSHGFRSFLAHRGTQAIVPNNKTRKNPYPFDRQAYRRRNLIERMFSRLKDFRRVATRYDKLAVTYDAAVRIAAMVIWWL